MRVVFAGGLGRVVFRVVQTSIFDVRGLLGSFSLPGSSCTHSSAVRAGVPAAGLHGLVDVEGVHVAHHLGGARRVDAEQGQQRRGNLGTDPVGRDAMELMCRCTVKREIVTFVGAPLPRQC